MAQSALTVTPPNPTPPTNMQFTGATGPNPPNYTKATYADWLDNTKFDTAPPPYYDDGIANDGTQFAANVAALASGAGADRWRHRGHLPRRGERRGACLDQRPARGRGHRSGRHLQLHARLRWRAGAAVAASGVVPRQLHHDAERQPPLVGERGPLGRADHHRPAARRHRPRPAATPR